MPYNSINRLLYKYIKIALSQKKKKKAQLKSLDLQLHIEQNRRKFATLDKNAILSLKFYSTTWSQSVFPYFNFLFQNRFRKINRKTRRNKNLCFHMLVTIANEKIQNAPLLYIQMHL